MPEQFAHVGLTAQLLHNEQPITPPGWMFQVATYPGAWDMIRLSPRHPAWTADSDLTVEFTCLGPWHPGWSLYRTRLIINGQPLGEVTGPVLVSPRTVETYPTALFHWWHVHKLSDGPRVDAGMFTLAVGVPTRVPVHLMANLPDGVTTLCGVPTTAGTRQGFTWDPAEATCGGCCSIAKSIGRGRPPERGQLDQDHDDQDHDDQDQDDDQFVSADLLAFPLYMRRLGVDVECGAPEVCPGTEAADTWTVADAGLGQRFTVGQLLSAIDDHRREHLATEALCPGTRQPEDAQQDQGRAFGWLAPADPAERDTALCGQDPCEHAPDGGNHPMAKED